MNKLPKTVEKITNITVVVAFFVFLGGFLFRTYENHQLQGPRVGESLPELKGYNWKASPQSLVLVLQKGCHFCEESMPFYRTLYGLESAARLSATMVAVFPDSPEEVNEILRTHNLPIPSIPRVNAATLRASGTPTLILVDQNRKVERTWIGELDDAGRNNVLTTLSRQRHGQLKGQCPQLGSNRQDSIESCLENKVSFSIQ